MVFHATTSIPPCCASYYTERTAVDVAVDTVLGAAVHALIDTAVDSTVDKAFGVGVDATIRSAACTAADSL